MLEALKLFKSLLKKHKAETQIFGNFSSLFMGLVAADGGFFALAEQPGRTVCV